MAQAQGNKLMLPSAWVSFHPFASTLKQWETGVPVDCGNPWSWETIVAAMEKGAHKSATSDDSIALIAKDVAYQVKVGYAQVLPWTEVEKLRPQKLKISPLAVIPQVNRRRRLILDLSFPVRRAGTCNKTGTRQRTAS